MSKAPGSERLSSEGIWREFGEELRGFVGRRIADPHRADDIVGEVLLRVHRNLHTVEDQDRLAAWVFRIARNAITDEYRRNARRTITLNGHEEALPSAPSAEDWVDDQSEVLRELATCMRPLLTQLPADSQRALELADLQGVTQSEAARLEGISVSGMKSRVQRGRRQLAKVLQRCCELTLDGRGMPVEYRPAGDCACN